MPVLRFVEFDLDLDRGELRRGARVVPLRSKSFALLATLAGRPGHLHSHAELMAAVWPGRVVGEDSIVQCVHDLREALGDQSKTLLRSVPRRGYRLDTQPLQLPLVAPDTASAPPPSPRIAPPRRAVLAASIAVAAAAGGGVFALRHLARSSTLAQERSVAVLPFADLGGDAAHAWFAEAITGEVIEDLARLPDTLVIAHASARHYAGALPPDLRQVGRDLDVRFVLTGSVARADPQVRVQARLSEAESGRVLWSDSFAYPSEREWNWRRDIGPQIAHALDLRMAEVVGEWPPQVAGPTSAVQQAMRGWALFARATVPAQVRESEAMFRSALGIDARSGSAWAGLANSVGLRVLERWVPALAERTALLAEGEAAAHRALAIDPGRASAAMALALMLELTGRREAALSMFERCISLDASQPRAHVLLAITKAELGRFDEVPAHIERSHRLSPREPTLQSMGLVVAGQTRFTVGDDDGARALMLRATAINPHQTNGWLWLAAIDALHGRADTARESLAEAFRLGSFKTLSAYASSNVGRGDRSTYDATYLEGRRRFRRGLRAAGMHE